MARPEPGPPSEVEAVAFARTLSTLLADEARARRECADAQKAEWDATTARFAAAAHATLRDAMARALSAPVGAHRPSSASHDARPRLPQDFSALILKRTAGAGGVAAPPGARTGPGLVSKMRGLRQ